MPTKLKNRDNCWLARVVINGRQVDSKLFPAGRIKGPQWMEAKNWEIQRKKEILAQMNNPMTLSGCELLLAWGERYLAFVEKTMSRKTFVEKKTVMTNFFNYCRKHDLSGIEKITKPILLDWLSELLNQRGPDRANRYRKNLLAAWHWGIDAIEEFPQELPALERIKPFTVESEDRYVPPEEDVVKVLQVAKGQDLVMLLTFYYTGARRGEVFRLSWKDVNLNESAIRLTDHKGGSGRKRIRWLLMHQTLVDALRWWKFSRPCNVENVFMRIDNDSVLGEPFTTRQHLMPMLCAKAAVKPFGFHALRHKAASIAFVSGGLNAAQILMGHSRATTTDRYVRSAGLYMNQEIITDALGSSEIAHAAEKLLKKAMPHEMMAHEAFCKQAIVNTIVQ